MLSYWFAALPQHSAVRLCLTGQLVFILVCGEAEPRRVFVKRASDGKPEAYRTVRRRSRSSTSFVDFSLLDLEHQSEKSYSCLIKYDNKF